MKALRRLRARLQVVWAVIRNAYPSLVANMSAGIETSVIDQDET